MRKVFVSATGLLALASALILGPADALAYRAPASLGFNLDGNAALVPLGSWEAPLMTSAAVVYVPVVLSEFKNYSLSARIKGNGTNPTWCWGARVDGNNNVVWSTGGSRITSTYGTVSIGSLNVTAGTSLVFYCELPQAMLGARAGINAFDWN
jgi:hypothetical protein